MNLDLIQKCSIHLSSLCLWLAVVAVEVLQVRAFREYLPGVSNQLAQGVKTQTSVILETDILGLLVSYCF